MAVDIGTMHALMAAGAPARAAVEPRGIGHASGISGMVLAGKDRAVADGHRVLQVALEAEIGVALEQHLLVHRAMGIVASRASFAQGIVFKNEGPLLRGVAFGAGFVLVLETRAAAFDGIALVRIVAFGAAHLSRQNGMAVREAEFAALVEVALEACFRRTAGIDDRALGAAGLDVLAARAVTSLATEAFGGFTLHQEPGMSRVFETLDGFLVALCAFLGSHERRARRPGWRHDGPVHHRAGNEKRCPGQQAGESERSFRPTTRMEGHGVLG